MAEFRQWFDDDISGIAGGASWFDISLDIGDGSATTKESRFKGMWKASRDSSAWRVSGQLEVR